MNQTAENPGVPRRSRFRFSMREERSVTLLCAIYSLRILGMYMVLPVLSPYAGDLRGATGVLTGLALGAYGLTQAIFQIPFGYLSDRFGRRRTIFIGMLLFAAGSVVAAVARTAPMLVVGRLLQGSGAVASAVVALTADLTRKDVRTQAMARLGVWLGASFAIGMTTGGFFARIIGVPGLFWGTAFLSFLGGVLLFALVPEPREHESDDDRLRRSDLRPILRQRRLVVLYAGTFLLHLALTAIFVLVPVAFRERFGEGQIWKAMVPAILLGLAAMVRIARISDRESRAFEVLFAGGSLLVLSCAAFGVFGMNGWGAVAGVVLFILAAASLEPVLPSLTTRFVEGKRLGAVAGGFHMSQFTGSFLGGLLGGLFLGERASMLFILVAIAAGAWMIFSYLVLRPTLIAAPSNPES
jgi:MFS family permease